MGILAQTSNTLIRIREFHIDYLDHAHHRRIMKSQEGFVLDASVTMAWFFADERNAYADAVRLGITQSQVSVPTLWPDSQVVTSVPSVAPRHQTKIMRRIAMDGPGPGFGRTIEGDGCPRQATRWRSLRRVRCGGVPSTGDRLS